MMNEKSENLITQVRQLTHRFVIAFGFLGVLLAGVAATYFSIAQTKRVGSLIENQALRIVNNAISSQDLLSIQTELSRSGEAIKESLGSDQYTEILIDRKMVAQLGAKAPMSELWDLDFVSKSRLMNGSDLEIRIFPNSWTIIQNWFLSIAFIIGIALVASLSIEIVLTKGVKKWLGPLLDKVNEIREITKSLQRNDNRRITDRRGDSTEISDLTDAVNQLLGAVEMSQKEADDTHETMLDMERQSAKDKAIAEISAMIAHDLRAPLGTFERLLYVKNESWDAELRSSIRDSLNRLYAMIESFRYGEVEHLVRPKLQVVNFSAIDSLNVKAQQRGIVLRHDLPAIRASLDFEKFERAWINLASNAVDFARGEVALELEIKRSDLILRVVDDGDGVPDDFLPKLFQRGATHGKFDGTGLGLAYVRQIMHGHGGEVSYRRENGLTIFECILPNAVESEEDKPVERSATLEIQLLQKIVRKVAICLEPRELSESVLAKLASLKSDEFVFIEERQQADIVVSNIDSIMFDVMESDEQELISVAQFKGDEDWMIEMLKLKFNHIEEVSGV